nr:MAG TPA: hypothetical protein [Caudoviricetes sp.]
MVLRLLPINKKQKSLTLYVLHKCGMQNSITIRMYRLYTIELLVIIHHLCC